MLPGLIAGSLILSPILGHGEGQTPDAGADARPVVQPKTSRPKSWKFATFFNQVRAAIKAKWAPSTLLRKVDPTGRRYGSGDRATDLEIEISTGGWVSACRVKGTSGIAALDTHAVAAVNAAQPFPEPPARLLDAQGRVKFRMRLSVEMGLPEGTSPRPPPPPPDGGAR